MKETTVKSKKLQFYTPTFLCQDVQTYKQKNFSNNSVGCSVAAVATKIENLMVG